MTWMPGASRAQDFSDEYPGSVMTPRVSVIHTTEGTSWPGYGGGASAPHVTILGEQIRQHYPVTRSARALVNAPGGVDTNTAGAVQIELVGTCDPNIRDRWRREGREFVFWPDATAADLAPLARFLRWLEAEHGVPMVDATPRGWSAYPASYGQSRVRMTGKEWLAARGIVGHQHVPENSHGDPGNIPIHLITSGDDIMQNTEEQYEIFRYFLARALRYDVRPLGAGPDWKLGPTLWERLALVEGNLGEKITAIEGADVDEIAEQVVQSLDDDLAERVLALLSERIGGKA